MVLGVLVCYYLIILSFFYILSNMNNFNRGLIKEYSSELYDSVFMICGMVWFLVSLSVWLC